MLCMINLMRKKQKRSKEREQQKGRKKNVITLGMMKKIS